MDDDGGVGTLDFDADVRWQDWRRRLPRYLAQCDRYECRACGCQCSLVVLAYPAVNNVGVDAMAQRPGGDGAAGLATLRYPLEFEIGTIETPFGNFGASLARHGVHDIHGAHYLPPSAHLPGVFPGRIRSS